MRTSWNRALMFLILTISMLTTVACGASNQQGSSTTTSSQVSTASSSTQTSGNTTVSSVTTTQPPKILKIGYVYDFSTIAGVDGKRAIDALVEKDNQGGGWKISGENYQVQVIVYDTSTNDQATSAAAVNRLIFQDKVKFILDMGNFVTTDLPITEANQVINFNMAIMSAMVLTPSNHYSYSAAGLDLGNAAFWGWAAKTYSLATKKFVGAYPDNMVGHFIATSLENDVKAFGAQIDLIFYPAGSTDFSAVATKVVSMKPDFVTTASGNDQNDANFYEALRQAGCKGIFLSQATTSTQVLVQSMSPEALEGFVSRADASEFNPPLTQTAKDVINIWTAKYGSWTNPNVSFLPAFFMVKAALEKAGSLDVDKVAAVLNNGMKFDTINGPTIMFSRTDLGNDRTVDSAFTQYIKKMVNGQPVLIDTISAEDGIAEFRAVFPPLPPGATPPGPGGPGGLPPGPPPPGPPPG